MLLVPLLIVEPLKLLALIVAGKGRWFTGTGMILGAYAVSLLVVERLFRVVKPKLMTISWFSFFACIGLGGCAHGAAVVADTLPQWLGGMPPDVPPRRGTPEYEAWQAERAKEAARPKTSPNPN
jgi:hypothetical protein